VPPGPRRRGPVYPMQRAQGLLPRIDGAGAPPILVPARFDGRRAGHTCCGARATWSVARRRGKGGGTPPEGGGSNRDTEGGLGSVLRVRTELSPPRRRRAHARPQLARRPVSRISAGRSRPTNLRPRSGSGGLRRAALNAEDGVPGAALRGVTGDSTASPNVARDQKAVTRRPSWTPRGSRSSSTVRAWVPSAGPCGSHPGMRSDRSPVDSTTDGGSAVGALSNPDFGVRRRRRAT
jgi:hypothetical protein